MGLFDEFNESGMLVTKVYRKSLTGVPIHQLLRTIEIITTVPCIYLIDFRKYFYFAFRFVMGNCLGCT